MNTNNVNAAHSATIRQTLILRAHELTARIESGDKELWDENTKEDLKDLCCAYAALFGTEMPNQKARILSGYD